MALTKEASAATHSRNSPGIPHPFEAVVVFLPVTSRVACMWAACKEHQSGTYRIHTYKLIPPPAPSSPQHHGNLFCSAPSIKETPAQPKENRCPMPRPCQPCQSRRRLASQLPSPSITGVQFSLRPCSSPLLLTLSTLLSSKRPISSNNKSHALDIPVDRTNYQRYKPRYPFQPSRKPILSSAIQP